MEIKENLLNRFLTYIKTWSESNGEQADSGIMPSTPQQWDMAKLLNTQLKELGLANVTTTDSCYTYGLLPATTGKEDLPSICFLAHIDTVDEVSGKDVNPQIFTDYCGNVIQLGNITLDPATDEQLYSAGQNHETIITTDGTTLLGADDKAGVAEIVTMLEYLVNNPQVEHGPIEVIFSPDEETGHGMDKVPLELLKSKAAYTVDGGHLGELEVECFNAYGTKVTFYGTSTHTGTARGKMVNAVLMASIFVSSLPRHQMPETTDGYQGFYAPMEITGSVEKAEVSLLLRDFDLKNMQNRITTIEQIANTVALSQGGTVKVQNKLQYLNMKEKMDQSPAVVNKLVEAYKKSGVEPCFVPIRGGTDGSRLTEMGIPTPNIFTGGHNFHSRYEWASLNQMTKTVEILIQLCQEWSK